MKNQFLLPAKFKSIGWIGFLCFLALSIATEWYGFQIPGFQIYYSEDKMFADYNLTNEFAFAGIIVSLLMISLARQEREDELIRKIRLESWQWAAIVNYVIVLVVIFATYGLGFLSIMTYNVITTLIVFIARFYYCLYILNRNLVKEI
ncbi:hypothetical protein [Pedobacter deserti]|uniref:hypothetical protein n=1 Tax=Pedobacter deserti TaxID=2817382 RepID=UPI00210B2078|nr:hypothetical protein [Pedobacter sp. SYSU D00382]